MRMLMLIVQATACAVVGLGIGAIMPPPPHAQQRAAEILGDVR